jgi:hypothetical protein
MLSFWIWLRRVVFIRTNVYVEYIASIFALNPEVICSSETSVLTRITRPHHISVDGIRYFQSRVNTRSYSIRIASIFYFKEHRTIHSNIRKGVNRTLERPVPGTGLRVEPFEPFVQNFHCLLFPISAATEYRVPSGELFLHSPSAAISLQATAVLCWLHQNGVQ